MSRRILVTSPPIDEKVAVSGVAAVVRELVRAVTELGHRYTVVQAGKPDRQPRNISWLINQLRTATSYCGALCRFRPQVVHVNGPLDTLALARDLFFIIAARVCGIPVVWHLHGGPFLETAPGRGAIRRLIQIGLRNSTIIICLCSREKTVLACFDSEQAEKIRVLPNALPVPSNIRPRSPQGPLRILYIGRFAKEKGIDLLVDALCCLEDRSAIDFTFEAYGTGPMASVACTTLREALRQRFRYGGIVQGEAKRRAFELADIVIIPSVREGFPMVAVEAMSLGVVVLTTPVGALREIIKDGDNGFVLNGRTIDELVETIEKAARAKASGELFRMASCAFAYAQANLNIDQYALDLERVYDEAVGQ